MVSTALLRPVCSPSISSQPKVPARAASQQVRYQPNAAEILIEEMKDSLSRGELHPILREEMRIIDPESVVGAEFQAEMASLLRRIYPEWDESKHPIRFLLLDSKEFNACQIRGAKPPILAFSKACFLPGVGMSLDLVASVLGHEGIHLASEKHFKALPNSKLEEAAADLIPLERIADAGFNPTVARKHFIRQATRSSGAGKIGLILQALDVHPTDRSRISGNDMALSRLFLKRGDLDCPITPLDDSQPLTRLAKRAHFESSFAIFSSQRKASQPALAQVLADCAAFLAASPSLAEGTGREIALVLLNHAKAGARFPRALVDELANALYAKASDGFIDGAAEALRALSWCVSEQPTKHTKNLIQCMELGTPVSRDFYKLKPLGRFAVIEEASRALVSAQSAKEAHAAAQVLNDLIGKEPWYTECKKGQSILESSEEESNAAPQKIAEHPLSALFRQIEWPRFEMEVPWDTFGKIEPAVRAPWERHLRWAEETDSQPLFRSLAILGIYEPRVLTRLHREGRHEFCSGALPVLGIGPRVKQVAKNGQQEVLEHALTTLDELGRIARVLPGRTNCALAIENKALALCESALLTRTLEELCQERGIKANPELRDQVRAMALRRSLLSARTRIDGNVIVHNSEAGRDEEIALGKVLSVGRTGDRDWELFIEVNSSLFSSSEGQLALAAHVEKLSLSERREFFKALGDELAKESNRIILYPVESAGRSKSLPYFVLGQNRRNSPNLGGQGLEESPLLACANRQGAAVLAPHELHKLISQGVKWDSVRASLQNNADTASSERARFVASSARQLAPLVAAVSGVNGWTQIQNWSDLAAAVRATPVSLRAETEESIYLIALDLALRLKGRKNLPRGADLTTVLSALSPDLFRSAHDPLLIFAQRSFRRTDKSRSLHEEVETWGVLHDRTVVRPKETYAALERLLTRVGQEQDPETRRQLSQLLVERKNSRIADPDLRAKCIEMWSEATARHLGRDDGSRAYHERVVEYCALLRDRVPPLDRISLFDAFAQKICAQRTLASAMRQECGEITEEQLKEFASQALLGDLGLDQLRYEPRLRKDIIDFLRGPPTERAAEAILRRVYEVSNRRTGEVLTNPVTGDLTRKTFLSRPKDRLSRSIERDRVILFHREFSSAPTEIRVGLVRELLCPAGIEQYVAAPHDYALDSLFAERTPKTLYVRGRARKYLFVVPPYVQPYAVSAIVAAGSAARRSNDNVGEAIASLIESIGGPAEHQTGQSAQGHPQTPDDIRQALAHLKTMASPPLRWDLMVHYHRTVPASLQAKILHVGEILGAGSMYIALEVTWHDGSTKVLSLLRPHAENRGETGFAFLEACFEDDASSTGEVVRELLKAGRGLMRTQLNSARAVEVGRRAQTVYRGRKVSIEGAQFDFAAPEIIEAAAGCFVSNLAVGPHIIDLKEQTRVERQDKRQVCMALVTTELVHLFSGGYFDNDRHGGNAKKQERTIQPFDLWGLLNEPGSEEAVRAFATAFFRSLAHARSMKSFQAQFAENLRTLAPKNDNYISNAQRALLVLAEYRSVLSLPDYLECLGAALPQVPAFVSEIAQKELSTTFLGKILSWRLSSVGQRGNAIVHERN